MGPVLPWSGQGPGDPATGACEWDYGIRGTPNLDVRGRHTAPRAPRADQLARPLSRPQRWLQPPTRFGATQCATQCPAQRHSQALAGTRRQTEARRKLRGGWGRVRTALLPPHCRPTATPNHEQRASKHFAARALTCTIPLPRGICLMTQKASRFLPTDPPLQSGGGGASGGALCTEIQSPQSPKHRTTPIPRAPRFDARAHTRTHRDLAGLGRVTTQRDTLAPSVIPAPPRPRHHVATSSVWQ